LPLRPPDTRDLVTFAQRRRASRDASQYDLANRVFNAARPYLGQRTPMPLVYWRSRTPGGEIDLEREAVVPTAAAWSRRLPPGRGVGMVAYPYQQDPWGKAMPPYRDAPARDRRQHFVDILLHELAHTQQDPAANARVPRLEHLRTEGGADAFAALSRDAVARRLGWGQQAAMPFAGGYGPLGPRFVRRFGPGQALYGQFGRRYVPLLTNPAAGTFGGRAGL
jgi:hypothetical protein